MSSIFELPQHLESLTGGATRVDMTQMYPVSGNVTQPFGATPSTSGFIGSGAASGLSTFQFSESAQWWSPSLSYFVMQLYVTKITGASPANTVPIVADGVALCDNFVSTLFTQIKTQINSRQLDIVDNVAVMDTALSYANTKRNFIKTFGSLTWLGQPFMTRLNATCNSSGVSGASLVEVVFRPCVSLFDCKLLPPGAQFRFDFNWAPSAQYAFESAYGDINVGTSSTDTTSSFNISVQSFSFFKASVTPSALIQMPDSAVIDLSPAIVNQYFLNSGAQLKQNISLPATTNRILVTMQDISASTTYTPPAVTGATVKSGIGYGFNPATSFSFVAAGSGATNEPNCIISNLYLSLPELGIQMPQPVYTFANSYFDTIRAYSDFCHITQGTSVGNEGSIPFGTNSTAAGIPITFINTTAPVTAYANAGDPNNDQALVISSSGTTATYSVILASQLTVTPGASLCRQMARNGWAGSRPGPIFAFNVTRPEGKTISMGTLNATFAKYAPAAGGNGTPSSVVFSVIASYSMAIQLTHLGNGQYSYQLVEGI